VTTKGKFAFHLSCLTRAVLQSSGERLHVARMLASG
jgi:hypothetical protein